MKIIKIALLLILPYSALAENDNSWAQEKVKTTACTDGLTVDQILEQKFNKLSMRDLAWRVFQVDEGFDVERAFMLSKSMELHFRWRVNQAGEVHPVSDRAQSLCAS